MKIYTCSLWREGLENESQTEEIHTPHEEDEQSQKGWTELFFLHLCVVDKIKAFPRDFLSLTQMFPYQHYN